MLDGRQMRAAELLLKGNKRTEIATELGITPQCLYLWQQQAEFRATMDVLRAEMRDRVVDIVAAEAEQSANTIVALRDGAQSEKVKLAASQDILDRAGFKAVDKVHMISEHTLSTELMELVKGVLAEGKRVQQVSVDVVDVLPERAT